MTPVSVMLPPVTLQLNAIEPVSPAAVRPTAVKSAGLFGEIVRVCGDSRTVVTADGPFDRAGISQAIIVTRPAISGAFIRASRCASLCRNVMTASPKQVVDQTGNRFPIRDAT